MAVSLKIAGFALGVLAATSLVSAASANPINYALAGTASQSTVGYAPANLANDGNTDGVFANGSVSETGFEINPFWMVNLGGLKNIADVVIYNRTDDEAYRLTDFFVSVINSQTNTEVFQFFGPAIPVTDATFAAGTLGDFVRIQMRDAGEARVLPLAEVQIYGPGGFAEAVPEPASLALLGAGVIGTFAAVRRRRVAAAA